MMRLLGFVTGAAGVIGATVMLLGAPAVQEATVIAAPAPVAATPIEKLAGDYDVPVPVAEPVPTLDQVLEAPIEATLEPVVEPAAEPESALGTEPPTDSPAELLTDTATPKDDLWHPFWQPFRSQIAANGFAARLAAITEIDYRVLRLKPGAYQVAFAYADELERSAKLAQIESATGLRVAEATP